jgi:protein-L-isoaspartate O-methyltransferase
MPVEVDPLGRETDTLFTLGEFAGRDVLEIGSGDGRLTWRYARLARHVTAVEPFAPAHERSRTGLPPDLGDQVTLLHATLAEFAAANPASSLDLAIFSWSL